MPRSGRALAVVPAVALVVTALAGGQVATAADPAGFTLRGSVNQLYVLDAEPGQDLELVDDGDGVVGTGTVDPAGSLAWRELEAGT